MAELKAIITMETLFPSLAIKDMHYKADRILPVTMIGTGMVSLQPVRVSLKQYAIPNIYHMIF